jgi:phosphatidylinositol 3-kinase
MLNDTGKFVSTSMLTSSGSSMNLINFEAPVPLILDPSVYITGINVEKTTMFKSNLMPCKFVFRTTKKLTQSESNSQSIISSSTAKINAYGNQQSTESDSLLGASLSNEYSRFQEYSAIYKIGDDLRQDQLVLQMIALMDKVNSCLSLFSFFFKFQYYRFLFNLGSC